MTLQHRFSLLVLFVLSATSTTSAARPNILLLVSDDQRPDTIGALGNDIIKTPALDRLVASGSVFTRATCANPICTPSRAEILTGCTGFRNGVFDFGRTISPSLTTLPEPFSDAGYATFYSGKWHNNGRPKDHGYESTRRLFTGGGGKFWKPQVDYRGQPITGYKGWIFRDENDTMLPNLGVGLTPHISEFIADGAIRAINAQGERPFFIHVNFTAPHDPLLVHKDYKNLYRGEDMPLPPNFRPSHPFDHGNQGGRDEVLLPLPRGKSDVQNDLAAYYAVISHMDSQIGRILDAIDQRGLRDNTIIVFTSDHGLAMGSHGLRGKQNMYEHTIGVPLIMSGPQIPSGKEYDAPMYLRDLFPTLCELASIDVPDVDGVSHVPVIKGTRKRMRDHIVGYFRDSQRMIRTSRLKLIKYPLAHQVQLFDLRTDPYEMRNVAGQQPEIVKELGSRLDRELQLMK